MELLTVNMGAVKRPLRAHFYPGHSTMKSHILSAQRVTVAPGLVCHHNVVIVFLLKRAARFQGYNWRDSPFEVDSPFYHGTSVLDVLCRISRQYETRESMYATYTLMRHTWLQCLISWFECINYSMTASNDVIVKAAELWYIMGCCLPIQ